MQYCHVTYIYGKFVDIQKVRFLYYNFGILIDYMI